MSIQRITSDNIENFTLYTYPKRTFVSSSSGITGSVQLFARDNRVLKDAVPNEDYGAEILSADTIENTRRSLTRLTGSDVSGVEQYMLQVNAAPPSPIFNKRLEVSRFIPDIKFSKDTLRKSIIKEVLFPYYRVPYPNLNWAFTNYHCLNFFTASSVPSSSALIYPAGSGSLSSYDSFPYTPTGSFTFEFYINPRYRNETTGSHFNAGTIIHLSSSYSISLISGSSKDINGYVDGYHVMLQLSHSADIAPSKIKAGPTGFTTSQTGYRTNLIFTSSEIPHNEWSHVAVRWESPSVGSVQNASAYSGSFVLNGAIDTKFAIPSSSIFPTSFDNPQGDPDALFVGNFYDGPNRGESVDPPLLARFFNVNASYHDGLTPLYAGTPDDASTSPSHNDIPSNKYSLAHPLNAELHDLRVYSRYKTVGEIAADAVAGPTAITDDLLFYLPVFFVKETRTRDVLQTPFKSVRSKTDDPFNVALSYGVGARLINLPNFTREFVKAEYPRLFHLSASEITATTEALSANTFLYQNPSTVKGNLTILPCDNGKFTPNFNLLRSGTSPDASPPAAGSIIDKFQSDTGVLRYDLISLNDLVSTASLLKISTFDATAASTGSIAASMYGATPEDPGLEIGAVLTILDRTRDLSSNEVSFFDVSNLFYGRRIEPESFTVTDENLSGSNGRVSMTLRDNGMGGLYRADSVSNHATWSTVGSIVCDEGLAVVTDPTAMFFGKDQFEVSMTGMRPLYVKEINVLAPAGTVNSSSNPNWTPLKPTDNENETANQFVYITHVNLHDDNFNIIGKATLAQPLVKRSDDKYLIRLKIDY